MDECWVHVFVNISFNQVKNLETSKRGKHCKVLIDIDVNLIQIIFTLALFTRFFHLGFTPWVAFADFHSLLNFYESFQIDRNDFNELGH